MTSTDGDRDAAQKLLGTYLRDHRAGAAAGVDLSTRMAEARGGSAAGPELQRIAAEVEEDQRTLDTIMTRLGVSPSQAKIVLGRFGQVASRLKLNDTFFGSAPLSRVLELEALTAGVTGKRDLWRSLAVLTEGDERLAGIDIAALEARASAQLEALAELHRTAAATAFGPAEPSSA